jgi:GAF domain-containing protein
MPEDDEVVRVAEMFADLARLLAQSDDVQTILDQIVDEAAGQLRGCEYAGISQVDRGNRITSPASSNDIPRIVDRIQEETDEGPCIDAIREHEIYRTGDLAGEERWPQFAKRAQRETGITSICSFRLFIEGDTMGALNLYSTASDAFDDTDVALGAVFAAHAAVAMSAAHRDERLHRMAENRDIIGRAKGLLSAHSGVDDAEAFDILRRASQRLNIRVIEVAKNVVAKPAEGNPEST